MTAEGIVIQKDDPKQLHARLTSSDNLIGRS
jgi:hypothetical protein